MAYYDDRRLLVEIAQMYYEERATQEKIAKKFNISRSLVSKYLTKARDIGIVEVIIHDENLQPYRLLEDRAKNAFGLKEVICISPTNQNLLKKKLGSAAEKYLSRVIQENSIVAVSAGTTVKEVAKAFSSKIQLKSVTFIPAVGGLGVAHTEFQANVICDIFAKQSGANCIELHAPVVVDTVEAKKIFMEQKYIKEGFSLAKKADIAIVGIGGSPVYSTMTQYYINEEDDDFIEANKDIVGDICYNFITKDGELYHCPWNDRVLTITLEDLKNIPNVIAVAGGNDRIESIFACIKGKIIDVLVTDATTLKKLLKMKEDVSD